MLNYIVNFIVYTLAMSGVLFIAFIVYKKTMLNIPVKKDSSLKITDMLRLPDRKNLYVIECMGEKFLIASSNENVSLISRVDIKKDVEKYLNEKKDTQIQKTENLKSLLKDLSDKNKKRGNF